MKMKTKPTSHAAQILSYLQEGGLLTPIEALNNFGCFRLAARISDLRNEGYDIRTKMIEVRGKTFAQYRLGK